MNLLERIDRRLDDRRARINPHDFEDCATSLLTALFPELVPVVGGSDHGLDAEAADDLERLPVGLIITSSRTTDGARKSLRSSLKSVIEHDLPVRRVMVANLAELNRSQRDKFKTIAAEFDCELVQIFDRAFFANQFRQHPDWRLKILGLTGGAFCLSRHPHQSRADDPECETVGRDALLTAVRATLRDTSADVLLSGVPGSGKSHIASRLPGALFLEDQPSPERLLDDLTASTPSVVVIDDAGGRQEELSRLLYVRRVENLAYRVVVTCWPHQRDLIADHLPHAEHHEVDLLTREEMGTLIRGRGVTRLAVVARILDQAQGRPAWALNLCDLIISAGDWQSLWTGNAVRSQILAYLRRSGTPAVAVDLLASIAILGAVTETQARRLGRLLEIPRLDLNQAITSVAVAGLIDVTQVPPYLLGNNGDNDGEPESLYSVEPRIVAASIVASSYFSTHPSPVRISELRDEFPEKYAQIVQSQIHCTLLGADAPILCSQHQFAAALDAAESNDVEAELLRSYAQCGLRQMRYVAAVLIERARNTWASGDKSATDRDTKRLAEQAADQLGENKPESTRRLLALLAELAATGYDCTATIDLLVAEVRDAHSGDLPDAAGTLRLAEVLSDSAAASASRSGDQGFLRSRPFFVRHG